MADDECKQKMLQVWITATKEMERNHVDENRHSECILTGHSECILTHTRQNAAERGHDT